MSLEIHGYAACPCPCCISKSQCLLSISLCCLSTRHVHAVCPCCLSMLHVPMLLINNAWPSYTFMMHVHAACPFCMSSLHVHVSMLYVQRCMSMNMFVNMNKNIKIRSVKGKWTLKWNERKYENEHWDGHEHGDGMWFSAELCKFANLFVEISRYLHKQMSRNFLTYLSKFRDIFTSEYHEIFANPRIIILRNFETFR